MELTILKGFVEKYFYFSETAETLAFFPLSDFSEETLPHAGQIIVLRRTLG
jgi:hypothetical protein